MSLFLLPPELEPLLEPLPVVPPVEDRPLSSESWPEPPVLLELLELLLELLLHPPPLEPRAPVSATTAIPRTAMART